MQARNLISLFANNLMWIRILLFATSAVERNPSVFPLLIISTPLLAINFQRTISAFGYHLDVGKNLAFSQQVAVD